MTYAIEAEQLVKHYTGRGGDVEAVRGVDLHVRQREVFGFLGPNGAGKSTTVRMLTTLMTLTSGSARGAGVDVTQDPTPHANGSAWRCRKPAWIHARPVASS
jgi:ABC-2 type transport system ATP-binding protein